MRGNWLLAWVLVFGSAVAAKGDIGRAKGLAAQAHNEMRDLAADMPFGHILYGREKLVRDQYKLAGQTLGEALSRWETQPEAARKSLKAATVLYRKTGLLMPFYAIDDNREAVVERYLGTIDRLLEAVRLSEAGTVEPVTGTFLHNGLIWKPLGVMPWRQGDSGCRELKEAAGGDWRLPTLKDLAASFRSMKDSGRNASFGAAAAGYRQVWTSDPGVESGSYYFIHFQQEQTGTAPASVVAQVVCMGVPSSGTERR